MKRIISVSLALFLLLAITAGGLVSAQGPEPELRYPFFAGDGRPCSAYSTVVNIGAGQVEPYTDDQSICYWVASVNLYGTPDGAKISFIPNWHPETKGSFMIDFWKIPEDTFPGGNQGFWVGYPLPAGLGTLRVGNKSWRLNLVKGENVFIFLDDDCT
jgi:hypothetical protein